MPLSVLSHGLAFAHNDRAVYLPSTLSHNIKSHLSWPNGFFHHFSNIIHPFLVEVDKDRNHVTASQGFILRETFNVNWQILTSSIQEENSNNLKLLSWDKFYASSMLAFNCHLYYHRYFRGCCWMHLGLSPSCQPEDKVQRLYFLFFFGRIHSSLFSFMGKSILWFY